MDSIASHFFASQNALDRRILHNTISEFFFGGNTPYWDPAEAPPVLGRGHQFPLGSPAFPVSCFYETTTGLYLIRLIRFAVSNDLGLDIVLRLFFRNFWICHWFTHLLSHLDRQRETATDDKVFDISGDLKFVSLSDGCISLRLSSCQLSFFRNRLALRKLLILFCFFCLRIHEEVLTLSTVSDAYRWLADPAQLVPESVSPC